jgi:LysR family transcriptional regulator of abg operon
MHALNFHKGCALHNERMGMKLHQLRYLVAIAESGSIRAAARLLGLSQASLTQALGELEQHGGLNLLERHSRGIGLTPAGHELLAQARRVLAQMDEAEQVMVRHRGQVSAQRLSVGVTPWVAQTLLAPVVTAFRQAWPQVPLELFDGLSVLAYPRLRDGSLDLMIGRIAPPSLMQGLQARPLFRYDMVVVARQGHPKAQARSITELLDQDWIVNFSPNERTSFLSGLFGQHGLVLPEHRLHLAHSPSLMLTLVQQTDMLCVMPWPQVETGDLRHSVQPLHLREHLHANVVGIIHRSGEVLAESAQAFVQLLIDEAQTRMGSDERRWRHVFQSVDMLPLAE